MVTMAVASLAPAIQELSDAISKCAKWLCSKPARSTTHPGLWSTGKGAPQSRQLSCSACTPGELLACLLLQLFCQS